MAQEEFAQIIEFLRSRQGRELSHNELETTLTERCRELMRALFQAQVDSRGPGPAAQPVCAADGVERSEQRLHERGLSTVFGEVRIKRLGYGAAGVDSLHALDAQLNVPAGEYSLGGCGGWPPNRPPKCPSRPPWRLWRDRRARPWASAR